MHKGIYQDKNKTWYIHTTIQGKSVTIRGYATRKHADDDYEHAVKKWKKEHNCCTVDTQYENILNDFFEYRRKKVSRETLKKDKMYFSYWNKLFLGQPLNNIFNIDRLKLVYNNACEEPDTKQYRLITCFNEFTSYCLMNNYITNDVATTVKLLFQPPKLNRHTETTKRYIPENDFKALLTAINIVNDNLFALAVSVLYSCGLRISELLGLLGQDIDLERKRIKVRRQLQSNGQLTDQLKTSNSYREVPMNNDLLSFMQKNCTKDNKRVFPYSHTEFRRKLLICEKMSQIGNYTAHEFRHTFCTNLAKKCSNISDVSYCAKVSGHTTSMFLNTYVKSLESEVENKFF